MQYYKFHHDLRFFVRTEYGISVQSELGQAANVNHWILHCIYQCM